MISPFRPFGFRNSSSTESLLNSLGNPFQKPEQSSYSLIYGVLLLLMSSVTALANGIVIVVLLKDPLKNLRKSPSSYLVLALASVDFVVGSVQELLNGVWLTYFAVHGVYPFSALVVFTFRAMLLTASMTALLALGCDRMISVRSPLLYKNIVTMKRVRIAVFFVWFHGLLHGIIYGNLLQDYFFTINMIFLAHVLVSFVVLAINYTVLIFSYRKHTSFVRQMSKSQNTEKNVVQRKMTVTSTVFVILTAFKICFLPWAFCFLLLSTCNKCNFKALTTAFSLTSTLMYVNSLINPCLYAYCIPKYKGAFKHFLKRRQHLRTRETNSTRLRNSDGHLSLNTSKLFMQRKNSSNSTSSKSRMIVSRSVENKSSF